MAKVAINGLGRIGRAFLKVAMNRSELEIVAVNDLAELDNLAYLLKYDSAYGISDLTVKTEGDNLVVNGRKIKFLQEADPTKLPWGDLGIDIVIEATGVFAGFQKSKPHLDSGAKRVVIAAPVKDEPPEGLDGATVLLGINEERLKTCSISSNASCTTNASSPLIQILNEEIGIEKAMLNTIHGYTATQKTVDSPNKKDFRKGRAAAVNIIPTSTGAAKAVTKGVPELEGKFDGIALRVPVVTGSVADITFIAKKDTTVDEVNNALKKGAESDRWNKVFTIAGDDIVSSDIVGSKYAAIADLDFTRVVDGNLVKVLSWYDNEMGYTHALVEHVIKSASYING